MSTLRCKQNDSGRDITALLKIDGVTPASPLTGTVVAVLKRTDFPGVTIRKTGSIVDANTWSVKAQLTTVETATPGTYAVEWETTQAGGTVITIPSAGYDTLIIDPELG